VEVPITSGSGDRQVSPYHRILVPIDGSDASINAAHMAVRMAAFHAIPLISVYVIDDRTVAEVSAVSGETVDKVRRQLEAKGWRYLEHVARIAKNHNVECGRIVREGVPHRQIADVVRDSGVDLIVLGQSNRHSSRRTYIGSTTEHVIEYVPCSVLIVKSS
jgi:nucleotide-binding universal stress UspA family protein